LSGPTEIYREDEQWKLAASVSSPEGVFNALPFHDLHADIGLTNGRLIFKNLRARTLHGQLRSDGDWSIGAANTTRLELVSELDAVEAAALLARVLPPVGGRLTGRLGGKGHFLRQNGANGGGGKETLNGFGEIAVRQGVIKNFNLISELLLRGSGTVISAASKARLSTGLAALASRTDTPFELLRADFTIADRRVVTEQLEFTTPDYTVTAAGWIGFDRSTHWSGSLILSPQLTQEVQRDYRLIRYLLDRRGRLAISFRADGKLPELAVRLENRALAQALRSGTSPGDGSAGEQGADVGRGDKNWLPDALERFLRGR
jgi:hypothetical protein